jgi:hypothetical protein
MNNWPARPAIAAVIEGLVYQYQGVNKDLHGKKVKVIAQSWPGSTSPLDAHLVHVQVMGRKGPTQTTFGCDPRWLSDGGLSPYSDYHNQLAQGNKNLKIATAEPFGLSDPDEDQVDLWDDDAA